MTRNRLWWMVLPVLLMLFAGACSSSNNNSKANANNAPASGASNSQQTNSGGGSSGDCAYASKIFAAFLPLTNVSFDTLAAATPGNVADAKAAVNKVLDSVLAPLNQSLSTLKNTTPPSDFKAFHTSFVSSIQQSIDQLNSAKSAATAGDLTKASTVLTQTGDSFGSSFDKLQQQYPQLTARLDKCPTPKP